jgi:hypothetical protein
MAAWPHIRGGNAASLMIAEKIQLKSATPDRQAARYDAWRGGRMVDRAALEI